MAYQRIKVARIDNDGNVLFRCICSKVVEECHRSSDICEKRGSLHKEPLTRDLKCHKTVLC